MHIQVRDVRTCVKLMCCDNNQQSITVCNSAEICASTSALDKICMRVYMSTIVQQADRPAPNVAG